MDETICPHRVSDILMYHMGIFLLLFRPFEGFMIGAVFGYFLNYFWISYHLLCPSIQYLVG